MTMQSNSRRCVLAVLSVCILVVSSTGCMFSRQVGQPGPVVFPTAPDVGQVVQAINSNASKIQQLHCENVRLSVPGQFGSVKATLDYERPSRIRLSGESLRGPELDLGSNELEYWIWVRQNQPPTVFFGRQDQFHSGVAHQFLPLPPNEIFAGALGILHLEPTSDDRVYRSTTPGLLQLRTYLSTARGPLLRVIELDAQRATVVRQLLYNQENVLLASVDAAEFDYSSQHGVSLPKRLKIQLPPAGLAFQLDVDEYVINAPVADTQTFEKPQIPNHRYLDMANPADMRGIQLLGNASALPDVYDNQMQDPKPAFSLRSAWNRIVSPDVFRR